MILKSETHLKKTLILEQTFTKNKWTNKNQYKSDASLADMAIKDALCPEKKNITITWGFLKQNSTLIPNT